MFLLLFSLFIHPFDHAAGCVIGILTFQYFTNIMLITSQPQNTQSSVTDVWRTSCWEPVRQNPQHQAQNEADDWDLL